MPETNTQDDGLVQGEMILSTRKIHGGMAYNAMIVANDGEWFFEQFVTEQAAVDYAQKYNLVMKIQRKEEGNV